MNLDINNPRSFYLSKEENQRVFEREIMPVLKKDFDLSKSKKPTVYLTAGLPGAGKSALAVYMLEETKNSRTFIANSDEMRPFHPYFKEAVEMFGSDAGAAVHRDASIFSEKSIAYAQEQKANFIVDGTMRDSKKAKELILSLKANNYTIKVIAIAVNKYESLHGIFNRYLKQYEDSPVTARFVEPKFIEIGVSKILESVEMLYNENIDELKVFDRDYTVLYDSNKEYNKSPASIIEKAVNIQNWSRQKLDRLKDIWKELIKSLQEANVPNDILQKAKNISSELEGYYL